MIANDPRGRPQAHHAEAACKLEAIDDFDDSAWPGEQTCLIVDDYRSLRGDRYRGTTLASTRPQAPDRHAACQDTLGIRNRREPHMEKTEISSFGVFKPVGHVVISFPGTQAADQAAQALAALGIHGDGQVRRYSDLQMLAQIDNDMQHASPIAAIGQELNLIKAHRELAERGHHWLVVRARNAEQATAIATCVVAFGAERAQHYGHFLIEELIQHRGDLPQVAESPDRGLDTHTPWERPLPPSIAPR